MDSPKPAPSRARACAASASAPTAWQASPPADPDAGRGGRVPEVPVERHHAVHVGAGHVEFPGQQRHGVPGGVAQLMLQVMQDRHQCAAVFLVLSHNAADKVGEVLSHPLKGH